MVTLLLAAMPFVASSFLFLSVMPGATSSSLLLVAMPGFLLAMPGASSNVLPPSKRY